MKPFLGLLFISLFVSCSLSDDSGPIQPTETEAEAFARNQQEIEAYLEANDITAQMTSSGLHYIINEEGTGESPTATSTVKVNYRGYFLNNSVFNPTTTTEFNLSDVITGFREGIRLMKIGGKATLFLPAKLGYGAFGNATIPPNTALVFDVELLEIIN
ncbi:MULTISPECIES: FKBP-type peptidyl-prolyl cis-trans isomerase [unclassified Leeuwenhoekiella]|uniref:FKBP-type peptidyl-prolyl cis-trans isomerase n=1 Tax=unclassified Leeuwenhoekiella TaxID=2615029 RepID=UPI000C594227|nr:MULTISPECIES: FKBP-type peptidyl-prolyl cis-trans isomerase [unclassified Leeuwenhoekiella]MAW95117.1 peptidylprolyl isomerase [Leeuwenhoekiella sp.]MBA79837.1 peptidylprolyl isomerase [Leeuwenhoekiella sp.]|tara:strand:+ start:12359 stop:12835 length:477 start_codon:yes stop_codon:yes gene_type:complete